jgi:hypothetical protein
VIKYRPVRVPFSEHEYDLYRKLSASLHISKDSVVLRKIIKDKKDWLDNNSKVGIFISYGVEIRREKYITVYLEEKLYAWLSDHARKLQVSVPWLIRYLVLPDLKSFEHKERLGS